MRESRDTRPNLLSGSPLSGSPRKSLGIAAQRGWSRIGDFRGCPAQGRAERLVLSRVAIHVDLDGAGEQRAPSLQIGLNARIAGDPLAVELDDLVGLVFHFMNEAGWIVHILQQAKPVPAERLVKRRRRFYQRRKLRGIRRGQGELKLYGSPYRLRFFCHRSRARSRLLGNAREN